MDSSGLLAKTIKSIKSIHVFKIQMFFGASTGAPLLFDCPPQYTSFIYLHIGPPHAGKQKSAPVFVRAGDAVPKQPKMKMMLTLTTYLEVMMLHQIGRK